jgi:uncharacterized RDD family membrane protein YckC
MSATGAEARRAGFVSRSSADLLDAILVCLATILLLVGAAILRTVFGGSRFGLPHLDALDGTAFVSIVFVAYLAFFWATTGRTPGKQAMGLRVVTSAGRPLGGARALGRAILCTLFPLGLAWVVVSPRNRAVHDVLLGTAVIYDWTPRRRPARRLGDPASN